MKGLTKEDCTSSDPLRPTICAPLRQQIHSGVDSALSTGMVQKIWKPSRMELEPSSSFYLDRHSLEFYFSGMNSNSQDLQWPTIWGSPNMNIPSKLRPALSPGAIQKSSMPLSMELRPRENYKVTSIIYLKARKVVFQGNRGRGTSSTFQSRSLRP